MMTLDPAIPGFFADPYDEYRRLRDKAPIHVHPSGTWMVFRYADVTRVLRDPALSSRAMYALDLERTQTLIAALGEDYVMRPTLTRSDPPDHTRLRRLLSMPFTPRAIEPWRQRIHQLVEELLKPVGSGGPIDLMADVGRPLAYRITCEMLGMPTGGDEAKLVAAAHRAISATMEPFGLSRAYIEEAQEANRELYAEYREAVQWKRDHLGDDLLSTLVRAEQRGDLSLGEVIDQVGLLFSAGHTTTFSAIGLAMISLMRHRAQWELLCGDPGLIVNAVEECLRYDTTIQGNRRATRTDFELSGVVIPKGSLVFIWQGSANRDEAHWGPTAADLDIRREGVGDHLSFGSGPHLCLGAWLARAEMQAVLGTLARRFPRTEMLTAELDWQPLLTMRGPTSLPLQLAS